MAILRNFFKHEDGRVSIEYSLLIVFLALALVEFQLSLGHSISRVWSVADTRLEMANTSRGPHDSDSRNARRLKIESGSTFSASEKTKFNPSSDDAMPHD